MDKIIIFGAGNIGRSVLGRVFAEAGFELVNIDTDWCYNRVYPYIFIRDV